jgi:geranylgeranyl diphosphate synthase type I
MEKISERIHSYNGVLLKDNNPLFQNIVEQFVAIAASEKAKYIRGCLIALGYKITQAQDTDYDYSIDLAAAYELFQTSILVHDDVFDNAGRRRDVTTVHEKIKSFYSAGHENHKELIAFNASSLAVCMGDLGFYFINERILNTYRKDKQLAGVLSYFNKLVMTTIKGEMLDIALPLEERLNIPHKENIEDYVFEIDTLKTAEYTTIGPLCLGLTLGGAERQYLEKFEELLKYLGIAFQIKDDWLNIYGTPEQGKPLANDISEFKMTLFYSEVCKNEKMKRKLLKYYGRENLSAEDVAAVKEIFEESGAKEKAERTIAEHIEKCRDLLRKITFKNEDDKDILFGFILFLELRLR